MANINAAQDSEVGFISGVSASGYVAGTSFWTWNNDDPATYGPSSDAAKWGSPTAGTGAAVTFQFAAASNWTATEKAAFVSALHLWSAVANITFTEGSAGAGGARTLLIERGDDDGASGGGSIRPGIAGSRTLGTIVAGDVSIDTSVRAFGPIGADFQTYGGYPWTVMLHELGHAIGLGHAGAYDDGVTTSDTQFTRYDSLAWSVMSYVDERQSNGTEQAIRSGFGWGSTVTAGYNYGNSPTTFMPLDILAVQRLYGVRTDGPLSGGNVFGFHSNVAGDIGKFYDFTVNTRPVVTIWSSGTNNTLDLSGFATASAVDLHAGSFSSVAGLTNNLAIAYDTRIGTAVGGGGADTIRGNDDGNYLMGSAAGDTLTGGAGNDHIYGNAVGSVQGAVDGADVIDAGAGSNYVNGNAGADQIRGGNGSNRLYGGADNDTISAGGGNNSVNGNLGDDRIELGDGNNVARGGQGNDVIAVGNGDNFLYGDLGNDVLRAGAGTNILTGGGGADLFVFGPGRAAFASAGAAVRDVISDFSGEDRINLGFAVAAVLHDGTGYAAAADAYARAQQLLGATAGTNEVAALQVGSDTLLFYDDAGTGDLVDAAIRLGGIGAGAIGTGAFTTGTGIL